MQAVDQPSHRVVRFGVYDGLPPSDNHLYRNGFKCKRCLTTEGRLAANGLKAQLIQQWMLEPQLDPNRPYGLVTIVFMDNLYNATYGAKRGSDSKFKKVDASNRGKLVEDVVSELLGVDDSSAFDCLRLKRVGVPHVEIYLYEMEESECTTVPGWLNGL